ncbi:hypothetical protein EPUL_001403, partial [Erysiphe pulchra]
MASAQPHKEMPTPLRSILAGSTAGAIEIGRRSTLKISPTTKEMNYCSYHLSGRVRENTDTVKSSVKRLSKITMAAIWKGLAGIRFVAFDQYKALLRDSNGNISGARTVIAGFGAGVTESLLAVTPFESIKTTLIDDRKNARPRMRGFLDAVPIIARERGVRGFFQGFVPTTARQSANSAVRLGSYAFLRQLAQSYVAPGEKLGAVSTFGLGGMAGFITVFATQPLDTIKTRMQGIEARTLYKNSFTCASLIAKNEGILTFWSGAMP